ncbi:hypothetical protein N431DRAFT_563560 [Stipitochalara longipes BDJ]|nr:hypothetical protein N431DRAFT_563560 [Stipitochalara longipes BDJ]
MSGSAKDKDLESRKVNGSETSGFMFVNESSDAPMYKSGNRRDVRAHVRKVVSRQFGLTHKTSGQRAERSPKYAPLTMKAAAPAIAPNANYHQDCSKCASTIDQASLPTTTTLIEITESRVKTTSRTIVTQISHPVGNQPPSSSYCHACGQPLRRQLHNKIRSTKESNLVSPNGQRKKSNPVGLLGAGRVDPFSSLPMDETGQFSQELLDHAITYTLPGLWPDAPLRGEANPLSKAWFSSSLRLPLLLHALIYSGSNHLDYMRHSAIYPNAPKPLAHKLKVIQNLNGALSDPNLALSDEVILAILILASQEVFMGNKGKRNPFNSPLQNLGWLNVYGNFKFVPQHTKAVGDIVVMRGGLETIKLHGLAEIIASGDVISATNTLSKPGWPQLRRHTDLITAIRAWATTPPWPSTQIQASAFWSLRSYGVTDAMLDAFDSVGALTHAIEIHLQGRPFGQYLGTIHRTRTAIQHSILMLPKLDELPVRPRADQEDSKNVYECCRLTAIIFGVAVIYPIPNSHDVLQQLVSRLQIALIVLNIETCESVLDGVLLWVLVLGGIAALDKPERSWFASQLGKLVKKLGIDDWSMVEEKLEAFLWLESACSQGGYMLWDEALFRSFIEI